MKDSGKVGDLIEDSKGDPAARRISFTLLQEQLAPALGTPSKREAAQVDAVGDRRVAKTLDEIGRVYGVTWERIGRS